MAHYFTNVEDGKSNEKKFQVTVFERVFEFITDIGVFSKGELDEASRFLIETADDLKLSGDLLDVGCGYGAVGLILASRKPEVEVHMIDINNRALDLSKRNAALNSIQNIQIYESNCYENVRRKFANIVSNPPIRAGKKVVHQILEEAIYHLEANGTLIIVIGKQHGAESARKKMFEVFGNVERVARKKGFWILRSVLDEGR